MTTPAQRTGWTGWVVFAGVILVTNGFFNIIQGLIAVIGPDTYYVAAAGSLWLMDVNGWGWWSIIIGALTVLTGAALLAGQTWARVVAVIIAIFSAISQMILLPAQPWWALIVIALDVLVIYAVTVHGREMRDLDPVVKQR
ncbi:hypothetical protein ASD56_13140 [Microbacterium sp. Root166]|uniref:DUF7144 family membrane protein n=1 Tax=Microbacterium sp. Root166 TaxID=1736478 RepID=UPI0006F79FAC|nr:hypothetical protein [Microbacterium sp. Root166]KQZ83249.1 hypothetical protein ASD56_13140 [Microbacterium sp. Root166]